MTTAHETPDHFAARVEARTGVALAAIPDGAPELMLGGQILCRRGRTTVVTVGYPTVEDDGEVYTAFAVVDRESDLPAYAG